MLLSLLVASSHAAARDDPARSQPTRRTAPDFDLEDNQGAVRPQQAARRPWIAFFSQLVRSLPR